MDAGKRMLAATSRRRPEKTCKELPRAGSQVAQLICVMGGQKPARHESSFGLTWGSSCLFEAQRLGGKTKLPCQDTFETQDRKHARDRPLIDLLATKVPVKMMGKHPGDKPSAEDSPREKLRYSHAPARGSDTGSGSGPGRVTRCLGPRADSGKKKNQKKKKRHNNLVRSLTERTHVQSNTKCEQ